MDHLKRSKLLYPDSFLGTLYIEDRKEYLETPQKLGMNVIYFKSASQLKRELKKKDVKI